MNIHFAAVDGSPRRLSASEAKARGLTLGSSKGTAVPRTREGATYPGGKHLRRARTKLAARRATFLALRDASGDTEPGSMK